MQGLDKQFPLNSDPTVFFTDDWNDHGMDDSPSIALTGLTPAGVSVTACDSFQTYVMYKPADSAAGPSQWVALSEISWMWNGGTVKQVQSPDGTWPGWGSLPCDQTHPGSIGTVTAGAATFSPVIPQWLQVDVENWIKAPPAN